MKKFLPLMLVATLVLGMPSLASARLRAPRIAGEVTQVETKTITIKQGTKTETIFVPDSAKIVGGTLSDLVGKHVRVKQSSAGTAKEIIVAGAKKEAKSENQ